MKKCLLTLKVRLFASLKAYNNELKLAFWIQSPLNKKDLICIQGLNFFFKILLNHRPFNFHGGC